MEKLTAYFESIRSLFSSVGLFDILDILIVAVLIYAILTRIKSSSAMRIAATIVLLLVLTWLTEGKMRTLHFILSKILEIGVIALVIVFQPELRRMLEHIGARSLSLLTNQKNAISTSDQVIANTARACGIMAKERTGVLIVFEREITLDDYMKSGTVVDAAVSEELLRNIFFTKASLHDGAVIIRNNRIAAAGCVLPLTESKSISSDLGTRHRAAVGISEASDGIAVIVSEETGTISVAVGGMLKRSLSAETLEKLLKSELNTEQSEKQDNILAQIRAWLISREEAEAEQEKEQQSKENGHEK